MLKTSKIRIACLIFLLLFHRIGNCASKIEDNFKIKTIVLDAGHGGHDTGCNGPSHSFEKDVTLKIILLLGKYIEEKYPSINVLYSRKTDVFITLQDRALLANKNNADLFLSVHCNANPNKAAYGTETYLMGLHVSQANLDVAKRENAVIKLEDNYKKNYDGFDPDSPEAMIMLSLAQNANIEQSTLLASKVQDNLTTNLGRYNRGVKQAGFWVLYRTTCPSILIESGFLTNSNEEKYLTSSSGQQELARAIFKAFEDYKNAVEKGIKNISSPTTTNNEPQIKPTQETSTPKIENSTATNQNSTNTEINSDEKKGIIYNVQIKAADKLLPKTDKAFKLSSNLVFEKINGIYKYMFGPYKSYNSALIMLKKAKADGYKDAFITVYKDGNRLTFNEAKDFFK